MITLSNMVADANANTIGNPICFPQATANKRAPNQEVKLYLLDQAKKDTITGTIIPGQRIRHPDRRTTVLSQAYNDILVVREYCTNCDKMLLNTSVDKHLKLTGSIRCKKHPYFASVAFFLLR